MTGIKWLADRSFETCQCLEAFGDDPMLRLQLREILDRQFDSQIVEAYRLNPPRLFYP